MKQSFIIAAGASALLLAACGQEQSESGSAEQKQVFEMGTSAEFAPFESRNPQGDIVGFDIDLANYIADELGVELEITDMKFDGLIGALQNDRVDLVLAGMSATDARKENVDF